MLAERESLEATSASLATHSDTAKETLADMRKTLERWDAIKKRFGEALDATARRLAEDMV